MQLRVPKPSITCAIGRLNAAGGKTHFFERRITCIAAAADADDASSSQGMPVGKEVFDWQNEIHIWRAT